MCDELGIGNEAESEHLLNDQPEVGNEEQRKTPNQAIRRVTALTCRMKEDFVGKPVWILGWEVPGANYLRVEFVVRCMYFTYPL
ncbi:hypothetical protein IFM89_038904 [Coptis chinensis]|uniref:Uncharacterized protein n=1 Tax=Coptis chinensis TaxID=261450 RepID=A0A835IJN1_9MAGN|nr:hypothetical protein IFM89_038904 [Coptis chinensis]